MYIDIFIILAVPNILTTNGIKLPIIINAVCLVKKPDFFIDIFIIFTININAKVYEYIVLM